MHHNEWLDKWMDPTRLHPTYFYAGPWDAEIVVVGQTLVEGCTYPFAGEHDTLFAWESFGPAALEIGWTVLQEVPPQLLRNKNGIIGCGERAGKWVEYVVDGDVPFLKVATPRYLFTRLGEAGATDVCKDVKTFAENYKQLKDKDND